MALSSVDTLTGSALGNLQRTGSCQAPCGRNAPARDPGPALASPNDLAGLTVGMLTKRYVHSRSSGGQIVPGAPVPSCWLAKQRLRACQVGWDWLQAGDQSAYLRGRRRVGTWMTRAASCGSLADLSSALGTVCVSVQRRDHRSA